MKVVDPNDIHDLKKDVVVTMSMLEMHMTSRFFNVKCTLHMAIHIVKNLELYGPIHMYWM